MPDRAVEAGLQVVQPVELPLLDERVAGVAAKGPVAALDPPAVAARYDRRISRVVVRLSSGIEIAFAARDTEGLERARPADLEPIEISLSGLGLHFPRLDADLYLPALLEGVLGSRRWLLAHTAEPAAE